MWYLIVIFISASINLNLIKIFPQVLADYNVVFHGLARDKLAKISRSTAAASTSELFLHQYKGMTSECVAARQCTLFTIACKDFYDRLSSEQKHSFRDIFSNLQELHISDMLKAL